MSQSQQIFLSDWSRLSPQDFQLTSPAFMTTSPLLSLPKEGSALLGILSVPGIFMFSDCPWPRASGLNTQLFQNFPPVPFSPCPKLPISSSPSEMKSRSCSSWMICWSVSAQTIPLRHYGREYGPNPSYFLVKSMEFFFFYFCSPPAGAATVNHLLP